MIPVLIIGGLFVLYEVMSKSGGGTGLLGALTTAPAPAQPTIALPGLQTTQAVVAAPSNTQSLQEESQGVSAALNFIPVAGPMLASAFNAISGGLIAASAKRAAAARSENAAVAAAVPGWDAGVRQVVAAYNAGQLTLAELYQFMAVPQSNDASLPSTAGVLWSNYWNETGPQIQAQRNGCQTGTVKQPTGVSFCSGSYGASCCVGYDDLKNGAVYVMQAAKKAEASPGVAVTSTQIPQVFGSKYGGINRPGYMVTLKKPATSSLFAL
jgi:hypothetical protein